jgi:hypothetical protein
MDCRIQTVENGMAAMLLGIVERAALLQMLKSDGQLATPEQGNTKRSMRFEEERWVLRVLGQTKELRRQLVRRPELCAFQMEDPKTTYNGKEQSGVPELFA